MAAVLASLLVLLVLLLVALLYVKCRLNVLLWYQDTYGEVEMNGMWGSVGITVPYKIGYRVQPRGLLRCQLHAGFCPGWREL